MTQRVSLKDIARKAGVSAMTVSRALRNDPRVLAATKKKILGTAKALGYQPDPNLQKMMGYMRKARVRPRAESIALVWPDIGRESMRMAHLQRMVQSARERAEEFGFGLEEFWLKEKGMTGKRLCSILNNRGIQCMILAPIFRRVHGHVKLEWDRYSVSATGFGLWRPQLHRVQFDHYGNTVTVMRKLAHQGCKRIALMFDKQTNERMHRACEAAFLAHHPLGSAVASRLVSFNRSAEKLREFMEKQKPEGAITDPSEWWFKYLRTHGPMPYATLAYQPRFPDFPGIDQRDDLLGAYAVDLVVAQFHRGERGVPEHPKVVLCQGEWRSCGEV